MLDPLSCIPLRWRPAFVLAGGVLIHISLGTLYCIGNLVPYMGSYLRTTSSPHLSYGQMGWLNALTVACQGLLMFVGGQLERRIGPRLTSLIGSAFVRSSLAGFLFLSDTWKYPPYCGSVALPGWFTGYPGSVALTYFALKHSLAATYVTYGVGFGTGIGIVYSAPMVCAMKWLPQRKGLVAGIIVGGFGAGALIFDRIQTAFVNPHNKGTDLSVGQDEFFTQPDILEKVPYLFLMLAACYAVLQVVGCIFLSNPADYEDMDAKSEDAGEVLTTTQVLKTQTFYFIWLGFFFSSQATLFISSFYKVRLEFFNYKTFGAQFINDDDFLALTGSIASVGNFAGRIIWGHLGDLFSYQVAMASMTALISAAFFTFEITSHVGKPMYFIWVFAIYFLFSGAYSLYPLATARCFGQERLGINYGMVFTSQTATSLISATLSQLLLSRIGYAGIFLLIGGFTCISFLLAVTIHKTDYGKPAAKKSPVRR